MRIRGCYHDVYGKNRTTSHSVVVADHCWACGTFVKWRCRHVFDFLPPCIVIATTVNDFNQHQHHQHHCLHLAYALGTFNALKQRIRTKDIAQCGQDYSKHAVVALERL